MITQYFLADGTLLGVMVPNQYRLIFLRDNNDAIYGFKYYKYVSSSATYNYNQTYYYEFNLQGDVVALYNAAGTLTATYKYDAWGKLLGVYDASGNAITSSTSLGIINPIRYRGYLYDTETGFYYLQSRYYDPEVGRFLNLDAYLNANGDFIGFNMYAYCSNNPVISSDPTGTQTIEDPYTGAMISIPDAGLPSNEDLAIMAVREKTDANHDGVFDDYDISLIMKIYNIKANQKYEVMKRYVQMFGPANNYGYVYDVSVSFQVGESPYAVKIGFSSVSTPQHNVNATYFHVGVSGTLSTVSSFGYSDSGVTVTHSAGMTYGVTSKEAYSGSFFNLGVAGPQGADFCFYPGGSSAYAATVSNSYSKSCYIGYDYYWCLS